MDWESRESRSREHLLSLENNLWVQGYRLIAGLDEAGRGPLAGPVVAACVVFEPQVFIDGVYDSKKVPPKRREALFEEIISQCRGYGIGIVDNHTIDRINIYQASKLAMLNALEKMDSMPDHLLIDALNLGVDIPQSAVIKGDARSFTIAAASILAKVTRDRIMQDMHEEYPVYGWAKNKGYPTQEHRDAVKRYGFSPYHRRSFAVR